MPLNSGDVVPMENLGRAVIARCMKELIGAKGAKGVGCRQARPLPSLQIVSEARSHRSAHDILSPFEAEPNYEKVVRGA